MTTADTARVCSLVNSIRQKLAEIEMLTAKPSYQSGNAVLMIKSAVAAKFGVTVKQIDSRLREHTVARARYFAMRLCKEGFDFSVGEIARYFGRHHSDFANAMKRTNAMLATEPRIAALYDEVKTKLLNELK